MHNHDTTDEEEKRTASESSKTADEPTNTDTLTAGFDRRTFLKGMIATEAAGATGAELLVEGVSARSTGSAESGWEPKDPPLDTPWTDDVSPDNAHPEYPRPQMVRKDWQNLNGVWQFAPATEDESPPIGQNLDERILVPYPVESALSGIMRHESRMWYRRTFSVPHSWLIPTAHPGEEIENNPNARRLLLHFEAVDWDTTVYVNGQKVESHKGGYDSFTIDITDALTKSGEQELVVGVYDPTDNGTQPVGKQVINPYGFFHTPSSGIWQTVWMEPVPETSIQDLDMSPDLSDDMLDLTVKASNAENLVIEATAYDGDKQVGRVTGPTNEELQLPIQDPILWSPENPFLYDLEVELINRPNSKTKDGRIVDSVESYFGMRSFRKKKINGKLRPTLNGEFVYHLSPLDQGYWPDGLYTAPTDEALRFDLEKNKGLGFNTNRKHVKVEPKRWFYWADKIGVIVWQDMPNLLPRNVNPSEAAKRQFEKELREMVTEHDNHPSVAVWVPFNEGWGVRGDENTEQWIAEMTQMVSELDAERLVDTVSGQNVCGCGNGYGDVTDIHFYPGPVTRPPSDKRFAANGEYTNVGQLSIEDHIATEPRANSLPNAEVYVDKYVNGVGAIKNMMKHCWLSTSVFTSLVDIGREHHGLITYDRRVVKPAKADSGVQRVREAHRDLIERSKTLASNPPDELPSGLNEVGFWPFNEGSGQTTADEVGDNDATLVNGPAWTSGTIDDALHFDGEDDYVDTGATILDTFRDYTVATWVQLDDLDGFQTAVSQAPGSISAFFLQYIGGQRQFAFTTPGSGGRAVGGPKVQTDEWYHIAGTFNCEDEAKLYVNGEQAASVVPTAHPADGNFLIGRGTFRGPVDFWNGKIDQVHAYQSALSNDEIKQLYDEGSKSS